MRKLWQLGLAAAVAAILAAPVAGQGTTTGMTGGQGGQGGASQQLGNTNQQSIGGTSLATQQKAPTLTAPGTTSTSTNRAIDASNFLQQYYANPYYSGILTNAKNASFVPGGFGQTTFTTTGTGGTAGRGGQIGFAGGTGTGTTAGVVSPGGSSGGGFAARGGGVGGGAGGVSVNLTDPGGQIVALPRQIAYPAVARFTAPLPTTTAVQADLRGMLDRSTAIANPAGVQVAMGTDGAVVLRGAVRDEDEARTVEGMVRLTPGVRAVKNELTFPKP